MRIDTMNPGESNGVRLNGAMKNWKDAEFPYKAVLSLKPLASYWTAEASKGQGAKSTYFQSILQELQKAPALLKPIEDSSVINKHQDLIELVITTAFPLLFQDNVSTAAVTPFRFRPLYTTPSFQNLGVLGICKEDVGSDVTRQSFIFGKTIYAGAAILKQFYGMEIEFDYPIVIKAEDPQTGLERHYKFSFNPRFVEIKKVGKLKELTSEDKERLLDNLTNLDVWLDLLPPDKFEFHGFTVVNAVDVTAQEVLSSLKNDLLEKDALVSTSKFDGLQQKLRAILKKPDLRLGLAGVPGATNYFQDHQKKLAGSFILDDRCRYQCATHAGSIYEQAIKKKEMIIVEDLTVYPTRTEVEEEIVQQGIRNLLVAPLRFENKMMGLLELGSPNPGDINDLNAIKLKEVFALFSVAIRRSMDEMKDRIEAVIKDQCTAIHPSVEWRFRKAAMEALQKRKNGIAAEMEEIVFDEVYPLYAMSDIRGSSTIRNDAIRADLIEHLNLAKEIILLAYGHNPLPFLDKLRYQIEQYSSKIEAGIGSGDEVSILDFLHWKIECHFDHLQSFGDDVAERIRAYKSKLDPQLGVIYKKRKAFEESVNDLNEVVSNHIERRQAEAQAMFPHYFEKYKSDGVEYGIYIGASLVENGRFDPLYLKNIRLWQFMLMCEVVQLADRTKSQLQVPLNLAHLILVQNSPLSVRFRYDEKKFDVDGAYNVRYEIMKKRIDKARIKNTGERLTQPGKIAIVYSQIKEVDEYKEYVEYLQANGTLTDELEDVELEDLQGMSGLKALRVTLNMQTAKAETPGATQKFEDAVEATETFAPVAA